MSEAKAMTMRERAEHLQAEKVLLSEAWFARQLWAAGGLALGPWYAKRLLRAVTSDRACHRFYGGYQVRRSLADVARLDLDLFGYIEFLERRAREHAARASEGLDRPLRMSWPEITAVLDLKIGG